MSVTGTLGDIVDRVNKAGLTAPAIIIIGEVVKLRRTMQWFENRPLFGKRIVVTRARAQASDLIQQLSHLGAECFEYPTIRIRPPSDWSVLHDAIETIADYDWLIFTSVNGVKYFFEQLFERGKDVRSLGHLQTAAIGPATADKLLEFGLRTDIVPENYRAESVVAAFDKIDIKERKILLPRAGEARPVLPKELTKMGARVDEISVYHTEPVTDKAEELIHKLESNEIDLITFTSSSTVTNFKALLPESRFETLVKGVTIASIGPITTDTAEKLGFRVDITADTFTIPGLCDAIVEFFAAK